MNVQGWKGVQVFCEITFSDIDHLPAHEAVLGMIPEREATMLLFMANGEVNPFEVMERVRCGAVVQIEDVQATGLPPVAAGARTIRLAAVAISLN